MQRVWRDVPALDKDMRRPDGRALAEAAPGTLAHVFGAALAERDAQLAALKQGWVEKADNLLGWIEGAAGARQVPAGTAASCSWAEFSKPNGWACSSAWAQSDADAQGAASRHEGKGWNRFTP